MAVDFPIFKTKTEGITRKFNLADPEERKAYFELKAGPEIQKLRDYLQNSTFVGYLLGKKNSGKGTYSKLFMEAVDAAHVAHVSVGDIVRAVHQNFSDNGKKQVMLDFLEKNYRGYVPLEQAIDALLSRSTQKLLPTELALALVKWELAQMERKALFIDGFPRDLDQVSYSLYFRDLIGYRDDPDFFVFISIPEKVIDARMKSRVVCPLCQTPRSLKLLMTKEVGFDQDKNEFYLKCDNPPCNSARMVSKEGDELGIEAIRERIEADEKVMQNVMSLAGIPKIFLRNAIPVDVAKDYVDEYEITPEYRYEWDAKSQKVKVVEQPWTVNDDRGIPSYSLLAPPVAVSLIKQMAQVLGL